MNRLLIIIGLLAVAGGIIWGVTLYNKPHQNIEETSPAYTLTSQMLFADYSTDESLADEKYLNQIIQVKGIVKQKTPTENGGYVLILEGDDMFGINCAFQPEEAETLSEVGEGDDVEIKGICSGMLMDVSLSRCTLAKK